MQIIIIIASQYVLRGETNDNNSLIAMYIEWKQVVYLGDMMIIDSGPLYRRVNTVQTTDNDHCYGRSETDKGSFFRFSEMLIKCVLFT